MKASDVGYQPWPGLAQLLNQALDRFSPQLNGVEVPHQLARAQVLLYVLLRGFPQHGWSCCSGHAPAFQQSLLPALLPAGCAYVHNSAHQQQHPLNPRLKAVM